MATPIIVVTTADGDLHAIVHPVDPLNPQFTADEIRAMKPDWYVTHIDVAFAFSEIADDLRAE